MVFAILQIPLYDEGGDYSSYHGWYDDRLSCIQLERFCPEGQILDKLWSRDELSEVVHFIVVNSCTVMWDGGNVVFLMYLHQKSFLNVTRSIPSLLGQEQYNNAVELLRNRLMLCLEAIIGE